MPKEVIVVCIRLVYVLFILNFASGCGQPLPPTGGPRDSLPPVLARSAPAPSTINFFGNRIVLEFDEYVTVDNPFEKLVFSPVPKVNPVVEGRLKTVTIRLKDILEPNTTYTIDFGDAIKDVNENNILRNFRYTYSTGPYIDSLELSGRVFIAESGATDSTFIAVLHRSMDDSAVAKQSPRFYTRLDKEGNFTFRHLPAGQFRLFALRDADGGKKYDQQGEYIAFLNEPVNIGQTGPVIMYAFSELPPEDEKKPAVSTETTKPAAPKNKDDKRLKYSSNLDGGRQDILKDLVLTFETPLANYDTSKLLFADENFTRISAFQLVPDTTPTKLILKHQWIAGKKYNLVLQKDFAADSTGNSITRSDTLEFSSKREVDYGGVRINISNLDTNLHPILQFYKGEKEELAVPLKTTRIQYKLFNPGEYSIRILYDSNNNGKWDTGNYWQKVQPEKVVARKQKLNIRPNWENEFEINLSDLGN